MLRVDKKLQEELSIPWNDALVVNLLGNNLGFNIMKAKLDKLWNLKEGFEIMDLGHGFYMVKFDYETDRNKVINRDPWMIFYHYLTMRLWSPEFNAAHATIDKTFVWIRVPSLNLLWYDESIMLALASAIGNLVKVDLHTLRVARGRFATVCVEVDLNQLVVGKVGINDQWFNVEYEGLHIICAQYGYYGHLLKDCLSNQRSQRWRPSALLVKEGRR